jgi:hypothetical protein
MFAGATNKPNQKVILLHEFHLDSLKKLGAFDPYSRDQNQSQGTSKNTQVAGNILQTLPLPLVK